jgi:ribonuclease J
MQHISFQRSLTPPSNERTFQRLAPSLGNSGDHQHFRREERTKTSLPVPLGRLRIIPLGGLGEIGKNMMAYEFGRDIIVVDCGVMFPEERMLGVDIVLPDVRYLEERKDRIRGIVITHGHEDHIGGLPFLWPKLGAPIFGSPLSAGFIEVKFQEYGIKTKVNVVNPGDKIRLGSFTVEFFHLTHSIPGAMGLSIDTPVGLIVHVTDFKFDHTPINDRPADVGKIAAIGRRGVLCLMSESTNIEIPGTSPSEATITGAIDDIFKKARGRIIFASFASMINRIQQVMDLAHTYHRRVAISGRTMEKNIDIAMKLGYLKVPQGILTDIRQINRLPDDNIVILSTGSQGEEYSALVRMASGEHRQIKIKKGDTVLISASEIPGNESAIHETIDNLYRQGATVVAGKEFDVHVSGHGNRDDLKRMIELIKPKYFIPIHGEYRMLVKHAQLAQELGIPEQQTIVVDNGEVVEFDQRGGRKVGARVPAGYILVDGTGIGDVGNIVLRDRQAMAKEGIFVVIVTVENKTGKMITSPDIISRGFVYMRASEDLIFKARQEIKKVFTRHNQRRPINWDFLKKSIRDELGEFLFKETQRRPMIIPVVIQV